jgi:hypothetical protein
MSETWNQWNHALQPCSTCPEPASGTGASVATRGAGRHASVTHSVHPLTQRRAAGRLLALLAARSAQRGSRCRPAATLWGARSCAVHASVVWASRAARATPSRPRPLSLSRSHRCCANRAPLVPTDRPPRAATANTRFPKNPLSASGQGARRAALPCARKGAERALPLPRTRRALTLTPSLALALAPSPSSSSHPSPNPQGSNQVQGGVRAARPRRPSSALPRGGARATHTRSPPTSPARIQTRSLGLSRGLTPNPNP